MQLCQGINYMEFYPHTVYTFITQIHHSCGNNRNVQSFMQFSGSLNHVSGLGVA
jgi:hypothetical protein